MNRRPSDLVRAALQAYVDKDRAAIEALLADDYRFTSPLDNGLDRATYFRLCWPNSAAMQEFACLHAVDFADHAIVVYEVATRTGKRFRNAELHTVRGDRIVATEVYFGWDLPHKAPPGEHLEEKASRA